MRDIDPTILRTRTVGVCINLLDMCAEQMNDSRTANKLRGEIEKIKVLAENERKKGPKRKYVS